mgnify:CR=1 FL=1
MEENIFILKFINALLNKIKCIGSDIYEVHLSKRLFYFIYMKEIWTKFHSPHSNTSFGKYFCHQRK